MANDRVSYDDLIEHLKSLPACKTDEQAREVCTKIMACRWPEFYAHHIRNLFDMVIYIMDAKKQIARENPQARISFAGMQSRIDIFLRDLRANLAIDADKERIRAQELLDRM